LLLYSCLFYWVIGKQENKTKKLNRLSKENEMPKISVAGARKFVCSVSFKAGEAERWRDCVTHSQGEKAYSGRGEWLFFVAGVFDKRMREMWFSYTDD